MTAVEQTACACGPVPTVDVGGVPVHPSSPSAALVRLEQLLDCGGSHVVNHIAADAVVQARDDDALMAALQRTDMNLADGMAVVWASRILGGPAETTRVYGPDFMISVAEWGMARNLRHAFVGGADPGVLDALLGRLGARFPGVVVAGADAPPIREVSPDAVAADIRQLQATATSPIDVLWVGLGTPKQQLWADLARPHGVARVIVTVGAAFDFLSGRKPQAPGWIGRAGLEWLFRLVAEPRRLWRRYLLGNPRFVARIGMQLLRTRWARHPSTS